MLIAERITGSGGRRTGRFGGGACSARLLIQELLPARYLGGKCLLVTAHAIRRHERRLRGPGTGPWPWQGLRLAGEQNDRENDEGNRDHQPHLHVPRQHATRLDASILNRPSLTRRSALVC